MVKIKPGDEITAIYQHTTGRSVILLSVTKVGRKYIHGVTISPNPEGHFREGHPTKVNLKESTIYHGLRHDLRGEEFKYRDDYRSWQNQRQTARNDINRELQEILWSRMEKWAEEHPMPERPELPNPEAEG